MKDDPAITFLHSLVFAKTDGCLEIVSPKKITSRNQTCFRYRPLFDTYFITLNMTQINQISDVLIYNRRFSEKWLLLEVLLHEIAHYKQYKRNLKRYGKFKTILISKFMGEKERQHEEDVADRYAHFCRKRIVKEIPKWLILKDLLNKS